VVEFTLKYVDSSFTESQSSIIRKKEYLILLNYKRSQGIMWDLAHIGARPISQNCFKLNIISIEVTPMKCIVIVRTLTSSLANLHTVFHNMISRKKSPFQQH